MDALVVDDLQRLVEPSRYQHGGDLFAERPVLLRSCGPFVRSNRESVLFLPRDPRLGSKSVGCFRPSRVTEAARNIKVGAGRLPDTQMGPLVSSEQVERVSGYVQQGLAHGAIATAGASPVSRPGFFYPATVLTNTRPAMSVVTDEIFGPVLVADRFDDANEAASVANDSIYGLSAGIWTKDVSKAHTFAKKIQAGTVWVNCFNILDASLPFGGYKQSGWGREGGHEVLNAYTQTKSVVMML